MYMCEGLDELHKFHESKTVLPALTTLALRGARDDDYFPFDIHPSLSAASNLETLYVLDCDSMKCEVGWFS